MNTSSTAPIRNLCPLWLPIPALSLQSCARYPAPLPWPATCVFTYTFANPEFCKRTKQAMLWFESIMIISKRTLHIQSAETYTGNRLIQQQGFNFNLSQLIRRFRTCKVFLYNYSMQTVFAYLIHFFNVSKPFSVVAFKNDYLIWIAK